MEIFFVVLVYLTTLVWACRIIVARLNRGVLDFWVGFSAGTLYFIYIPLGIVLITGSLAVPQDYSGTSIPDVMLERNAIQLLTIVGMVATMLAYVSYLPVKVRSQVMSQNPAGVSIKWYIAQYLIVSALVFTLSGLGDNGAHWYRSKEEFLLNYGLFGVLLVCAIGALRVSLLVFSVRQFMLDKMSLGRMLGLLAAICAVDLYSTGNRIFTLLVLVTAFIVIVMKKRYGWLFFFLMLTPVLAYFMNIFRWIRSFMHSSGASGIGEVFAGIAIGMDFAATRSSKIDLVDIISGITESVNLNVLVGIVGRFGDVANYLYGETFLKALVFWVPRSLWATKPDSIATVAGNMFAPGDSVALIATFYGELFANFGVFSFAIIVPLLIMCEKLCARLFDDYLVRSIVSFVLGFLVVRMPVSDTLLVIVAIYLLVKGNRIIGNYGRALFIGSRRA